jgi:CBS domain-containing protein
MRISDILKSKGQTVVATSPTEVIRSAVSLMAEARVGALVVLDDDGYFVGLISEREIMNGLNRYGARLLDLHVGDIAVGNVPLASPDEPVIRAMATMTERRARHLPIVLNDRVVGLVSVGDVVKSRLDEKIQENVALQEIARAHLAAA